MGKKSVVIRWLMGCCVWLIAWHGGASYAQNSKPCRQKLQKKDFQGAASCFQLLFKQHPKKLSFLRNQGIIHRMWAQKVKAKAPTKACRLMGRAIAIFEQYSKLAKGVDRLEMEARVARLKGQRKLVSLSITTTPESASLLMVGDQYKKKTTTPQLITGLCPGTYHLRIEHKEHYPRQTTLVLKPGETVARNYVLRSRKKRPPPRPKRGCPITVRNLFGAKGCKRWRACRKQDAKACAWLGSQYQDRGDFLRAMSYSSMGCELGHHRVCLRAGVMHLNEGRHKLAHKYLAKGCDNGFASSCQRLGDFYAGRYPNRGDRPRRCELAIRTYHRACKLGRKASCTQTCNTVNVALPIIVHSLLHVGGMITGGLLSGSVQQQGLNMGLSLFYGSFGLAIEALYVPLWLAAFQKHHIGLPITATATCALPILVAISFYAGAASAAPNGIPSSTLMEFGHGMLMVVLPVHAMWAIYTWITYKRHEDIIKDLRAPKPKVTWIIAPTVTPQGAGFAISGIF